MKKSCADEACENYIVPGGDLAPQTHGIFGRSSAHEVVGHVFDGGEIGGGVVGPHAAFVVAEDHVQHPMQAVVRGRRDFASGLSQNGAGASQLTPLPSSKPAHGSSLPVYEQMPLLLCHAFEEQACRSRALSSRLNLRIAQATNVMLKCLKTGYIAEG